MPALTSNVKDAKTTPYDLHLFFLLNKMCMFALCYVAPGGAARAGGEAQDNDELHGIAPYES